MDEMNVKCVTLEDGNDYAIIKEVENYLYLVNTENEKDVCIRKLTEENGEQYIEPLKNEDELKYAYSIFKK